MATDPEQLIELIVSLRVGLVTVRPASVRLQSLTLDYC